VPTDVASTPALDPKTWFNLLTVATNKGDIFSAKSLMIILDGVEKLRDHAAANPNVAVNHFHASLFNRLLNAYNNPSLLKEVGLLYLGQFNLPGIALRHFDLAAQFAPKDRDIAELQKVATLTLARQATDQTAHSGIDEAPHAKPEVGKLIRNTTRLDPVVARQHLDETAGELERQQQVVRSSGQIPKPDTVPLHVTYDVPLQQARHFIANLDYTAALNALNEAAHAGATVEELRALYAQLGLSAFDQGRMDDALQAFHRTRDLAPHSVEGWFNCGLVYQKTGQLEQALHAYLEAARLSPDNPKPWATLSSIYFELGNYPDAEKNARHALELKPDYARGWDSLADVLSALNQLPEAAQACQQAIRYQPALASAWFKFGVIHFQQDHLLPAEEAFRFAADDTHYASYVLYYFSMIAARRDELDLAVQKLDEAHALDPTNELEISALKEIGAACTKIGRHDTAAEYYGQIIADHPKDAAAWLALGTAYHRSERVDDARKAYQRSTELQPENPVAWHNLGLLASEQNNHAVARECYQREVELCPDDAKAWYDLAVSLQCLGHQEESAQAYERAERLLKSNVRRSSDLSAALSIVRRLNLGERQLKTE
jgi:tetratricopeptide (TPR) repeat protein